MENKVDKYLNFILDELLRNTELDYDYGLFVGENKKYVIVLTPRLKQLGEDEGYIYSKNEVMEWTHTVGTGGIRDYKYLEDMYGLTWLESQEVIEKYVRILARKILDELE
jgi:hypothetical protein